MTILTTASAGNTSKKLASQLTHLVASRVTIKIATPSIIAELAEGSGGASTVAVERGRHSRHSFL